MQCGLRRIGAALLLAAAVTSGCATTRGGARVAPVTAIRSGSETGVASYYGRKHQGRRTASGERFDMRAMTAAHRTLPFGTRVKVTNLTNGRSVVVRINDRGPFRKGRILDLSRAAAARIGMIGPGTARVRVEVLGDLAGDD